MWILTSPLCVGICCFVWLTGGPFSLIAGSPRWLRGRSLPAQVSILSAVLLWIVGLGILGLVLDPDASLAAEQFWFDRLHWWIILLVLLAAPLGMYGLLRAVMRTGPSPYPDLEEDFLEGLLVLQAKGINIQEVPLFLIVGSPGRATEQALMAASGLELVVEEVPDTNGSLHWYASRQAVYLFCTEVGCLSDTAGRVADALTIQRTPASEENDEDSLRRAKRFRTLDQPEEPMQPAGRSSRQFEAPSRDELELQQDRLAYLCQLLNQARSPFPPLNASLVLLPYHLLQQEHLILRKVITEDLQTLVQELQLVFPGVVVIWGIERDRGFQELLSRFRFHLGEAVTAAQRLGRGADVAQPASWQYLSFLAESAVRNIEGWIYEFLKREGAQQNPKNQDLYVLLCQIRREIREGLTEVLGCGFTKGRGESPPPRIAGCYFAASGLDQDGGFVAGALEKLLDEQDDRGKPVPLYECLQWTDPAVQADARYRSLRSKVLVTSALLVGLLIALASLAIFLEVVSAPADSGGFWSSHPGTSEKVGLSSRR